MSEYVFCDRCNDSRSTNKVFVLPNSWVEAAGLPPGTHSTPRGYFPSNFEEAKTMRGWREENDGQVCEICLQLAADQKALKISTTAMAEVMSTMAKAIAGMGSKSGDESGDEE